MPSVREQWSVPCGAHRRGSRRRGTTEDQPGNSWRVFVTGARPRLPWPMGSRHRVAGAHGHCNASFRLERAAQHQRQDLPALRIKKSDMRIRLRVAVRCKHVDPLASLCSRRILGLGVRTQGPFRGNHRADRSVDDVFKSCVGLLFSVSQVSARGSPTAKLVQH